MIHSILWCLFSLSSKHVCVHGSLSPLIGCIHSIHISICITFPIKCIEPLVICANPLSLVFLLPTFYAAYYYDDDHYNDKSSSRTSNNNSNGFVIPSEQFTYRRLPTINRSRFLSDIEGEGSTAPVGSTSVLVWD